MRDTALPQGTFWPAKIRVIKGRDCVTSIQAAASLHVLLRRTSRPWRVSRIITGQATSLSSRLATGTSLALGARRTRSCQTFSLA